ncbi:MAG TPA: ABC transporter substrate-binding protein [Spirochaetia bacterium]|nr:ABC transporter substrate-binding protein [Spirochaetia bacterium]
MKLFTRLLIGGAAALIATAAFVSCTQQGTIKIGVISPLSGTGSVYADLRDGLQLAADEVNARGGVNKKKIKLIVEDDHGKADEAVAAFEKIEARDRPLFFVSVLSSLSVPIAPLAAREKVILFALVTASPEITVGNEWVYRFYSGAEEEADAVATIIANLRVKKLGVLYVDDSYGGPIYELTKQRFTHVGRTIIGIPFDTKTTDFRPQIKKLMDTSAIDVIALAAHYPLILSQLKEAGYTGAIICGSGASLPSVTGLEAAQGAYVATSIIYNPSYMFARNARLQFEDRFKRPFTQYAANGYDLIKLVAGLIENHEVSRESLKTLLEGGLMYSGVFGSLSLRPGEQSIAFPLFPGQIVNKSIKYQ